MSRYHLHARVLEGTLLDVTRNELQSRESDDWQEVIRLAEEFAERGFSVCVYDHGRPSPFPTACDLRVIAEFSTSGVRVR